MKKCLLIVVALSLAKITDAQINYPGGTSPTDTTVKEIYDNVSFRPSVIRFEGFRSFGKLEEIDDQPLLQNILYFYEQAIPQLRSSEGGWDSLDHELSTFFIDNKVEYDNGSNHYYQVILKPKAKNLCKMLIPWPQIYQRYNKIISLGSTIVKEIDRNYNLNK